MNGITKLLRAAAQDQTFANTLLLNRTLAVQSKGVQLSEARRRELRKWASTTTS